MFTFALLCIQVGTHSNTRPTVPSLPQLYTGYTEVIHRISTGYTYPQDIHRLYISYPQVKCVGLYGTHYSILKIYASYTQVVTYAIAMPH